MKKTNYFVDCHNDGDHTLAYVSADADNNSMSFCVGMFDNREDAKALTDLINDGGVTVDSTNVMVVNNEVRPYINGHKTKFYSGLISAGYSPVK